ncbi:MAG TPA: TIM-barrel domain-containing protein [Armatimonadota bacterium]|jgi:alpha-D-xyloside xylohydrolase
MTSLSWSIVAPGVWRAIVGTPEALTPLAVSGATPRVEALAALGAADFPFAPDAIAAEVVSDKQVIRLPLAEEEELFGLGLQFMRVNQRGRTRYLRVNSDPKQDTGETHAPVPFYVSSRGYGVLVNTARIPTFYCGSTVRKDSAHPPVLRDRGTDPNWQATPTSDLVEVVVPAPGVEVYVFAGPSTLEAVRRYNLFCGGGTLPPRWGLGFWHRTMLTANADEVLAEARAYRERGYPCDVIGLEPGWHSKSYPCTYEWRADRYPDPAGFVQTLRDEGFRVNLWENPYVSPDARIYPALESSSGSHTVWGGLVPDYTQPEARAALMQQHEADHVAIGVSGYKLDECDGSELTGASWIFPPQTTFPSGVDGEQMRQVFGLLFQRMTADIFHQRDQRTYGLVRAGNAGSVSLPYVLYSDLYDHRQFVRALCNSGFSGLLWTPELRHGDTAEEWVRRMQVVCLSPMAMLNAWASGSKPWDFPEVEPIVRACIELRMRLQPYLYAAFARYAFDGTPPFRAMALEETLRPASTAPVSEVDLTIDAYGPSATSAIDDQFLVGDSLLVAPLFTGERSRSVWLPAGDWFDFHTGERFGGGGMISITGDLDKLPIFVRDGGIIPLMPALAHSPRAGESVPLEVRHYGNAPGRLELFDDDGETFAYERGSYQWRTLEVTRADTGYTGSISPVPDGWLSAYGEVSWQWWGKG